MLLSSSAMAQNLPKGPSPLAISVLKKETNTTGKVDAKAVAAEKNAPQQGISPLETGSLGAGVSNAALKTGIAAPDAAPGAAQAPLPLLVTGSPGGELMNNVAPLPAQTDAGTNQQAKTARVNFLMETGVQYADEGEYKEAEQAYFRAMEADPGNPDLLFRLSMLYIQTQRYEEAAVLLEQLVKSFPDNPMLQNNLSWVYASGGKARNGKLALRHAHEALLLSPYAPALWNTLAEAHYVLGQYDKALRASDFALELLQMQKDASKDDIASFQAQHAKIQRAAESYKGLMKLDDGK